MHDSTPSDSGGERHSVWCRDCLQRTHCLPARLDGSALTTFEHSVAHLSPLSAGEALVKAGSRFEALYALRHGTLKCLHPGAAGDEHVLAFHFSGTVLGIAEQAEPVWINSHVALEDSRICRIPLHVLNHGLRRRLAELVSANLRDQYDFQLAIAKRTAPQRLAMLLIRVSGRLHPRRIPLTRFRLPMTYEDLASHLGMWQETLSRSFGDLHACGWIRHWGREIEIRDLAGLRRFGNGY